jgi:hypothetical protein
MLFKAFLFLSDIVWMKRAITMLLLFAVHFLFAQQKGTSENWFWFNTAFAVPVITNSYYYEEGSLELKVGGNIAQTNITLAGGVNNSLRRTPERFGLFIGPGYLFTDRLIFFHIQTGINYPFYKNDDTTPQIVGMHNALDLGIRIVPKFTIGVGLNQLLSGDMPAYSFRLFLQVNGQ